MTAVPLEEDPELLLRDELELLRDDLERLLLYEERALELEVEDLERVERLADEEELLRRGLMTRREAEVRLRLELIRESPDRYRTLLSR